MHDRHAAPARAWLPLLAGAVLGPALQLQQARLGSAAAYAGLLALSLLALAAVLRQPRWRHPALVLALAAAAGFAGCGARAAVFASQALDPALEGRDLVVTGRIAALPQRHEWGQGLRFAVEDAQRDGVPLRIPDRLALGWYAAGAFADEGLVEPQRALPDVRAGDRWRFTVRLRAPHGNVNPHGFDYELWLWEQGVQATGYVRTGRDDPAPQRIGTSWRHPVERARQSVRDAIQARIADPQAAGIVAALVAGDQNAIARDDWDVFRATGVAHLMSISGLHVTMFAWLAGIAVGWGWRRSTRLCLAWPAQHAALFGGLLLAAAYALFSGWGVPAQRTLLMLASVAWLRLSGRRWPGPATWLFACAVVVTADPWALMQPGFWLSFVAVGVLFATAVGGRETREEGRHDAEVRADPRPEFGAWPRRAARAGAGRLLALLREQGVVTLALSPLTLLLFGQVSLVGLVANLAAIPWVTLVVTPLAMLGVAFPPAWDAAALAVQGLAGLLQLLAALPFAVWNSAAPPGWAGAAGVLGGLLLAMRWPAPVRALGVPLLLPVLLWQAPRPAPGEFEVLAADVGQGNAVLVRTATHALLYDAGPRFGSDSDAGQRTLVPLLRALGERLDAIVLSHRDSDHTGGAGSVLAMQPQARLLASLEPAHPLAVRHAAAPCLDGQQWDWDGVQFQFVHPPAADAGRAAKPNALSCVLRIANGRQAALLAGDIEQPQEAALLARSAPLRAQLLLVPHHGSRTSSSDGFLDAVQPRWALVQAGYRNRFGHPAASVVDRYLQRNVALVESARCGAAWWSSARPEALRCERAAGPRYWQHRLPEAGP
ncbi:DNA internalization-related competence protein ComEC/Rec2 [Ramlibacter tataouinensis]|uniref:DNA internalization-related competence protein ComEC/Rec2 n=1 Tax=Ramlibacter tataouinensis TaxID=94132 RepID=UPI0022F3C596|nr:DNA internalization-related competence protein ComEC/Rec2 [Ramlibacter tataouinensis]WBY01361.1 DNA internalization-related competence protein ComEC/Rec2 [Ramlibacter tataouinensis]